MFKKVITSVMIVVLIISPFSNAIKVSAGKKEPSTKSYINLKNGSYTTDNTYFERKVFTNVCFTGVTKMRVDVSAVEVSNPNGMRNKTKFECTLVNAKTKQITTFEITSLSGKSFYFINMKKSSKYFLYFMKSNDTKGYSFTATMSNGE